MTDELAAIEALRSKSWVEDAHGEVVLLSDAEDALHAEQEARARVEALAAMLDDELRRVEAGYSTPESLTRARETYARALAPDASEGEPT